jgi:hypothetical protein
MRLIADKADPLRIMLFRLFPAHGQFMLRSRYQD